MTDACIIWPKAKNSRGYGVQWFDGKVRLAHRVAWFQRHGRWPHPDLVLDHICETKACVNVDHLRESTNLNNIARSPRTVFNLHRAATSCRNGHPYDVATQRDVHGHRICAQCPGNSTRRAES